MNFNAKTYWLHTLTSVHVGVGRGVGFIDLPIMREKVTNWPIVPGSSVKGVIADYFGAWESARTEKSDKSARHRQAFGLAGDEYSQSGALIFTDARVVCLPIRSLYGTFCWISSPMVMNRLKRDLESTGFSAVPSIPHIPNTNTALSAKTDQCAVHSGGKVFLEDLDLALSENKALTPWVEMISRSVFPEDLTWQQEFARRYCVVSDETFDFLSDTATEVQARIKIDAETKTVSKGMLWYEESLPAETILAGIAACTPFSSSGPLDPGDLMNEYCSKELRIQIGGKSTTGKGRVRCVFSSGRNS
ncbi:MAG: type III-B CRISPR module RAMP protein Cmr4 [candidate division Zixibacteria bacterium]|jgi:CRISPR-associated protein Cmr4|nr:type III-B CRISPR module RAMP protein Cmr4 [candidate division Zixibacteria bacterium]